MQSFRKKYIYNPDNPIYQSENVKTFNCINTETKDNRLALVQHLKQPPFVQPSPNILQPLEIPTTSQPFSVYPLVYCASQIGKLNQPDAMYVLKCYLEPKIKNPLYYVVSPQGFCCSQVEGILPNRSPPLFNITIDLLDIPQHLGETQRSIISKEGLAIVKGIRDNQNVLKSFDIYGWKDIKKDKENVKDNDYWIFKGRKKDQGVMGEEYGLAWNPKQGLCKFKYIDLNKDSYQTQFYKDFADKVSYFQQNQPPNTLKIMKCAKEGGGIKIFSQIPNQGTLTDYINKKYYTSPLNQQNFQNVSEKFIEAMAQIVDKQKIKGYGAMHIKNIYMHNGRMVLGEPMLITDKVQKKMRELKNSLDYYAPQFKQNIILPENLLKLDFEKIDIWGFGFILHKIFTKQVPLFDQTRKPIVNQSKISPAMRQFIIKCLSLTPSTRPTWKEINLKELQRAVVIEQFKDTNNDREEIKLGPKKQKMRESSNKKFIMEEEDIILDEVGSHKKQDLIKKEVYEQQARFKDQQLQQNKYQQAIPIQISSRLKKVKQVFKIIIIMLLYIFVFFKPFLGNSIDILMVRSFYATASLNLVDNSGVTLSTTTLITSNPNFFLLNDISFTDVQKTYKCISNNFDPMYNPSYSLLTYIQSSQFLALILTGWLTFIVICAIKSIAIWKGGISNRQNKGKLRYFIVYGFFQLSIASLLFAHFYIYDFLYYAGATPCLNISSFSGLQPYFDSTLYLLLSNPSGYISKIFSSLGTLSILICLSTCFYAWGPKLDFKYILSVPSVILRIIPYILFILLCRIGIFTLFSPTALNDSTSMIPAIIAGSSVGFFGIIPEMFIIICVIAQGLLQLFFVWCEKKAHESDRFAKLFNIRKKKVSNVSDNKQVRLHDDSLNQMYPDDQ